MLRLVRGVLVIEGEQTGDGRYIVPGAVTWAELPLPIAHLVAGDQHVDLVSRAPQIGNILTITRGEGGAVEFTGHVDDEHPDGADLIRSLEAGTAGFGNRQGISIDPDDWAYEVVDTGEEIQTGDTADVVVASGQGTGHLPVLVAAAGDGAPAGVIVYDDAADAYVQQFTRMRIRGVTGCSVPAFAGAYLELAGEAAAGDDAPVEEPADDDEAAPDATVVASASVTPPAAPPTAWFAMPEPGGPDDPHDTNGLLVDQFDANGEFIGQAVPLTITDDGHVFGHLAASWGQCHVGYMDCTNPPPSNTNYAHYHVHTTVCDDGTRLATGALTIGCDHADERLNYVQARDAYAHAGLQWGQVRCSDGVHAPWACGTMHPGLDDATVRLLRATVFSGDWRFIGAGLEAIAILSVNNPGFPIARETLAASAVSVVASPRQPVTFFADGVPRTLVAAAPVSRCKDCAERQAALRASASERGDFDQFMRMFDARTAHLIPAARDALLSQIRKPA